jgi:hypothetical protein
LAVIGVEETISSLIGCVRAGVLAGHYYLTDAEGRIHGFIAMQDILVFLAPYTLFIDGEQRDSLLMRVGAVPLKTFILTESTAGLPGFTALAEDSHGIDMMTCFQLLERFPEGEVEVLHAVS